VNLTRYQFDGQLRLMFMTQSGIDCLNSVWCRGGNIVRKFSSSEIHTRFMLVVIGGTNRLQSSRHCPVLKHHPNSDVLDLDLS